MTPNLRLALADWLAWAESDDWNLPSPDGIRYRVVAGLCSSAREWERLHGISASNSVDLYDELEIVFEKDGLDPLFPFGGLNFCTYPGPRDLARIAWVRETLREKP